MKKIFFLTLSPTLFIIFATAHEYKVLPKQSVVKWKGTETYLKISLEDRKIELKKSKESKPIWRKNVLGLTKYSTFYFNGKQIVHIYHNLNVNKLSDTCIEIYQVNQRSSKIYSPISFMSKLEQNGNVTLCWKDRIVIFNEEKMVIKLANGEEATFRFTKTNPPKNPPNKGLKATPPQ
jgi:hypothetical protein